MNFVLTSIGKQALAEAASGDAIILTKAYATDEASSTSIISPDNLSGEVVLEATISGEVRTPLNSDSYLHLEFYDDSTNAYIAKTLALIFIKDDEEFIFAIAADSESGLFEKTPSILQAVIDVQFQNASSFSFQGQPDISFPSATTERNGTVRIATPEEIQTQTGNKVVQTSDLGFIFANMAVNNLVGSTCLLAYIEEGNSKQRGSEVNGQYLKPITLDLTTSNTLNCYYDNNVILTGIWKLLTDANARGQSLGLTSIVLAVKIAENEEEPPL